MVVRVPKGVDGVNGVAGTGGDVGVDVERDMEREANAEGLYDWGGGSDLVRYS